MLYDPKSLEEFAKQLPQIQPLFGAIDEMAAATREALGEERIAWLRSLPRVQVHGPVALVNASPKSTWRAPMPEASDAELESAYAPLGRPIAVYGHVHRSYIRKLSGMTVANTGSVSLSYDGDRRAAYLLLDAPERTERDALANGRKRSRPAAIVRDVYRRLPDEFTPQIRRVEYDLDNELKALSGCGLPHAGWIAKILDTGRAQLP